jgi:hypothetical protein
VPPRAALTGAEQAVREPPQEASLPVEAPAGGASLQVEASQEEFAAA